MTPGEDTGEQGEIRDEIRLSLPAARPYGPVVTLTAAAIAARHGFGHDEITRLQEGAALVFDSAIVEHGSDEGRADQAASETTVVFRVEGPSIVVGLAGGTGASPEDSVTRAGDSQVAVERRG